MPWNRFETLPFSRKYNECQKFEILEEFSHFKYKRETFPLEINGTLNLKRLDFFWINRIKNKLENQWIISFVRTFGPASFCKLVSHERTAHSINNSFPSPCPLTSPDNFVLFLFFVPFEQTNYSKNTKKARIILFLKLFPYWNSEIYEKERERVVDQSLLGT